MADGRIRSPGHSSCGGYRRGHRVVKDQHEAGIASGARYPGLFANGDVLRMGECGCQVPGCQQVMLLAAGGGRQSAAGLFLIAQQQQTGDKVWWWALVRWYEKLLVSRHRYAALLNVSRI
jgi:hypothetical protein